jgi:hypothetical protein
MPSPRGGPRHWMEIQDLWIQYANCQTLYLMKCKQPECQKAKEATPEEKEKMKKTAEVGAAAVAAAAAWALAPELLPIIGGKLIQQVH